MARRPLRIAVTTGEPAGIGPDICAALGQSQFAAEIVVLGDLPLLRQRATDLRLDVRIEEWRSDRTDIPGLGSVRALHLPLARPAIAGKLDPDNATHVLALLDRALVGIGAGEFDALVTAPVQKSTLNQAGIPFSGHTEYLAQRLSVPRPVMLLVSQQLRVALATTHLPLRAVPDAITPRLLDEILGIIHADLHRLWGIARPRIAVCGLNPHAGEAGHLGDEELRVIGPAIERARRNGLDVTGPLPADTVFVARSLQSFDVVLAMYHDQGLPVLKHASFGHAVNVTLGLPIIRTSVDHGTALDLAGSGRADSGSLEQAVTLAITLAEHARHGRAS